MRRVELWVEARNGEAAVNPVMRGVLDCLRLGGSDVRVRVPERHVFGPEGDGTDADLILLKTATTLGLSAALAAEARGVMCLNRAAASVHAHDKAAVVALLADAGLPVPPTFLATPALAAARAVPAANGSWFVKPARGVHGFGVVRRKGFPPPIAPEPPPRGATVIDDGTRLVQAAVGGDSPDLKVYVAGDAVFAGRKRFGAGSFMSDEVERVTLDPPTRDLVHATGEALDLDIFGVDLRSDDGAWFIVDANPFPGFRGFSDAVEPLLREVDRAMER